jgi:hypothetical protein
MISVYNQPEKGMIGMGFPELVIVFGLRIVKPE